LEQKNRPVGISVEKMSFLKEKIISETRKLFSQKGFMSTSITDILLATGASKGGLYNHFNGKEALFYAVLEQSRSIWREKNLAGLDQIDSPIKKLIRFLENYRDNYMIDHEKFPGGCIFVNLSVELDDQLPHLARELEKGFIGLKRMIKRYLEKAKNDCELLDEIDDITLNNAIEIVTSSAIGAAVMYSQNKSVSDLYRTMSSLIDYVKSLIK